MDFLSFTQLSQRITEAKDRIAITHVLQALVHLPVDHERMALEAAATHKLKQLTS